MHLLLAYVSTLEFAATIQDGVSGPDTQRNIFFLRRYKDGAVLTLQKSSHYCASEPKRCQEIGVEPYALTLNLLTLVCMCFMEMKREFAQSDTYSLPFFEQNSQNGWHNANAEKNLIQFPLDIKYSTEKN